MPETHSSSHSNPTSSPPPAGKSSGDQPLTPAQLDARAAGSLAFGPHVTALAHPVAVIDTVISVTTSAGFAVGNKIIIDSEVMRVSQAFMATPYAGTNNVPVLRGQSGTATAAHAQGSQVMCGDAMTDFSIRSAPGTSADIPGTTPWSPTISMGATDTAVPLPKSIGFTQVILPVAANLTLALPTPDLNGAMLALVGNQGPGNGVVAVASTPAPTTPGGTAGHTITVTPGQVMLLLASGGNWLQFPTGTVA